jgi:hypothetical protein
MSMFKPMSQIVPEGVEGHCSISHFGISKVESNFTAIRSAVRSSSLEYVPEGVYCRLTVGHTLMMTDTHMEQNSNYSVVRQAKGSVLIAGLGIGMVLLPILEKPEVTSVMVIEKYAEVVKLVEPHIRAAAGENASKLKVIVADIMEWQPPKGEKWDTIYFDIWPDICTDNLKDMEILHRRFAKRKAPGGWMDSWMKGRLKFQKEREKRMGW